MNETSAKLRERLLRKFKELDKQAESNDDEIVLTEDGVETDNTYPLWAANEIDAKSPSDWVGSITFEHAFKKKGTHLDFILRPSC